MIYFLQGIGSQMQMQGVPKVASKTKDGFEIINSSAEINMKPQGDIEIQPGVTANIFWGDKKTAEKDRSHDYESRGLDGSSEEIRLLPEAFAKIENVSANTGLRNDDRISFETNSDTAKVNKLVNGNFDTYYFTFKSDGKTFDSAVLVHKAHATPIGSNEAFVVVGYDNKGAEVKPVDYNLNSAEEKTKFIERLNSVISKAGGDTGAVIEKTENPYKGVESISVDGIALASPDYNSSKG